jgi:60 kDa SS-A/Ro ribonucleoprotein
MASTTPVVMNAAGGTGTFAVDDMTRAKRFLILGAEGGTNYSTEQALAVDNASAIVRLLAVPGKGEELVEEIVSVSVEGRAAKQGPTLFALAMCGRLGDVETRRLAYNNLHRVCRIPTHLFTFIGFSEAMADGTGWGRLQRRAISEFYNGKKPLSLAHQVTKYRNREGWTHLDVLRLAHVKPGSPGTAAVLKYAAKGFDAAQLAEVAGDDADAKDAVALLTAVEEARTAQVPRLLELIAAHRLAREHMPSEHLNSVEVWAALLGPMPMTAMLRNLAKMTSIGLLKPLSEATHTVCQRVVDEGRLRSARVHPFSVLLAKTQYEQGKGDKGSLTWTPIPAITAALDRAFYASFGSVQPTGKRFVLALDVSGSMSCGAINGARCLTPRVAAAAMAMVTMRTEPRVHPLAFTSGIVPLAINPSMSLDQVIAATSALPFGGTDCAQPMLWALKNKVAADVFVIYTDCETWANPDCSPVAALRRYRDVMGIDAKLIVVAMTSGGFSLADPTDAGMLDVVGFDASAPEAMRQFANGTL